MAEVQGLSNVLKNLNAAISKIEKQTKAGLTEACLEIKRESVKQTPIDLGNLRGSCFIMVTGKKADNTSPSFTGKDISTLVSGHSNAVNEGREIVNAVKSKMVGIVSYSANYAYWVHEMPATTNWSAPGVGNKYLEKALFGMKTRIPQILKKHMQI